MIPLPTWAGLRQWWRTRSLVAKLGDILVHSTVAGAIALMAFGVVILVLGIVQEWQKGALVERLVAEVARNQILLMIVGLGAAFVALFVLLWVIGILWAWITLPLTLRQGVAVMDGLRLEVHALRREMHAALWRYDTVHQITRPEPPPQGAEYEDNKPPRSRWKPADQLVDPHGPKGK